MDAIINAPTSAPIGGVFDLSAQEVSAHEAYVAVWRNLVGVIRAMHKLAELNLRVRAVHVDATHARIEIDRPGDDFEIRGLALLRGRRIAGDDALTFCFDLAGVRVEWRS